ncbi:Rz1-like lysis system protein LysC [Yersinia alsatica]|uniref:Rz1-like lysis system protein LysC n=1 Tax=Yersinia alsatica TaxID=2890317 RepID=UPI003D9A8AD4
MPLLSACSSTRTVYVPGHCPIPANLTEPLLVPLPPRKLTYGEVVLWIDPLLTLLDRANNDRASIRHLLERHGKT